MEPTDQPVSTVMQTEFVAVKPGDHLDFVDDVMKLGRIRHMPVIDDGKLVGVVSQRDLLAASLSRALDFESQQRRSFMRSVEVGEVMARNPKWRQQLRIWRKYFTNWIERPEPRALMLASVFFDLRALHDPEGLFGELHEHVLEHSRANRIFIAYMAANALKHRPPLGFFRNFVLISGGDHDHTLDIKHRGTVPVV